MNEAPLKRDLQTEAALPPIPPAPPRLETPRLVLRPFAPGDAADVQRLAGDRSVAETLLVVPHPYPDGAAEAWIATHAAEFAAGREALCAIVRREDGALIGSIGLTIERRHARGSLGYWIGRSFWNRGYCTEAARALVGYGFAVLGLERIQAEHFGGNAASGRVLAKLGMQREGVLRSQHFKWGRFEDSVLYAVLRREWPGA